MTLLIVGLCAGLSGRAIQRELALFKHTIGFVKAKSRPLESFRWTLPNLSYGFVVTQSGVGAVDRAWA
jgi:hypothetical protein